MAVAGLLVLAAVALIALFGWYTFKTPSELLVASVTTVGVAAFAAAITCAAGKPSDALANGGLGGLLTAIGLLGAWIRWSLPDLIRRGRNR